MCELSRYCVENGCVLHPSIGHRNSFCFMPDADADAELAECADGLVSRMRSCTSIASIAAVLLSARARGSCVYEEWCDELSWYDCIEGGSGRLCGLVPYRLGEMGEAADSAKDPRGRLLDEETAGANGYSWSSPNKSWIDGRDSRFDGAPRLRLWRWLWLLIWLLLWPTGMLCGDGSVSWGTLTLRMGEPLCSDM